jgi:K319-like protein
VTLTGANTATPSFTAPTGPATLTFQLTVTDNNGATGTDTVTVNVNAPANIPPTANAGPDQTVNSGATVNLNGTGSTDPDGTIASYAWVQTLGPAVTLTGANTATPSFTAPTGPASLTFELTVTDNQGATGTDTVTINVNPPPMPDATGVVIVNGPVSSTKTSKSFVFKVTNVGTTTITVNPLLDISSSVDVNGTTTGLVTPNSGAKTLGPGASTRVKLVWSYAPGALATGDAVVFHACVNVTGDIDPTNNCDDQTATAK